MNIFSSPELPEKKARATFVRQADQSDCGVACLASVIAYHGGEASRERLRELSGTSRRGTTVLGLYQAAEDLGLEAGAYEASLDDLKARSAPCILHVLKDEHLRHFLVCYGFDGEVFLIGDPAEGVRTWTPEAVEAVWESRALLTLTPNDDFVTADSRRRNKWSWLKRLVRDDLKTLVGAAGLGLIVALLSLSMAIFSKILIDDLLPNANRTALMVGLALLAGFLLLKSGLTYVRSRLLIGQTRDFNNRVIDYFYGSLVHLPQTFFLGRKTGDLVARMNDTRRLQRAVTQLLGKVMIDTLLFLVALGFILSFSLMLGGLAFVSLPLFALLAYLHHRPILDGQRRAMAAHAANESNYVDTIQGMSTIKTTGTQERFAERTRTIYGAFQDARYALGRITIRFKFLAGAVGALVQVGVLAGSAYLVLGGQLELGMLVAILQMTTLLVPAAKRLALTNLKLQEARVAFDRMYEFTSLEPEYRVEEDRQRPCPERIERVDVRGLHFRFRGRPTLLKDVSFTAHRGEITALMGESGCGKTTLLHLLERFYQPDDGEIVVNDTLEWDRLSTSGWRNLIGVVPQQVKLFSGPLLENICLSDAKDEAEEAIAFCEDYGLDTYFEDFPQGYATPLGEQGVNISGGQRQLVALARALYRRPQFLLLDEPTAAMDRETETDILNLLARLKEERAVLMVTHRPQSARYADHIYVLADGRIQAEGTPAALKAHGDNLFARSLADTRLLSATPA